MHLANLSLFSRRLMILLLSALFVTAASLGLWTAWSFRRMDWVDLAATMIFITVMTAGSFNFWLYVIGFVITREKAEDGNQDPGSGRLRSEDQVTTRTAIVMPIMNEDPERVYWGARQTWRSMVRAGLAAHCDFFLLSDSTDTQTCRREEKVVARLREELADPESAELVSAGDAEASGCAEMAALAQGQCQVADYSAPTDPGCTGAEWDDAGLTSGKFYLVRREKREKFKAGNIAHFLEKGGWQYDFLLVLDADSVMFGETVKRLILRMQQRNNVGILQTVMLPIRAATPFAQIIRFGAERCLRIYAAGMYWFYGPESVYWGHNALLRIEPFMRYCNLPIMPGKPPSGGHIMSQDIVEAALLGRAGWAVEWDVDAGGSFDEVPANVLTYGKRDRRWCQGNFQHFWLIFGDRMRLFHRLYFANGIFSYAAAPLFLTLLLLGFVQGLRGRAYRLDEWTVVPFIVFFGAILLVPRILGFLRVIKKGVPFWRELKSAGVELFLSVLISPSFFYLHGRFILEVLTGHVVPWKNQSRNPHDGLNWGTSAGLFWLPTLLGTVWLIAAAIKTPAFLIFLLPVLVGWVLSIPMAVWTSNSAIGNWLTKHALLEEVFSPKDLYELGPLAAASATMSARESGGAIDWSGSTEARL